MNPRRVRAAGRPVYGRVEPLSRPARRRTVPRASLPQRRLVILAVLLVVAAYGLWRAFEITQIQVDSPTRASDISTEISKLVRQSFTQRNVLTVDTEVLMADLQQADPLLRTVKVRRSWPHGLVVTAAPKQPSLGWESGDQRYLLDRDGTVIGVLASKSPLPVVTDGSNLPVKVGSRVVSAHFVTFVTDLVSALAGQGIGVKHLDVKDTTYDLTVTSDKSYKLVFDTSRTAGEEVSDLNSVLALLKTQNKAPAEYIDLRIAGKAYYK